MDWTSMPLPSDSSVCGIFQARILEWVAISYYRGCGIFLGDGIYERVYELRGPLGFLWLFPSVQMSSFPSSLYHKRGSWDCTWVLGPQQEEAGRYSPQAHPAGETPVVPRAGHCWDPRSFSALQGWSSPSVPAICNSEVYDPGVISSGSRGLKSKPIRYARENSSLFFCQRELFPVDFYVACSCFCSSL